MLHTERKNMLRAVYLAGWCNIVVFHDNFVVTFVAQFNGKGFVLWSFKRWIFRVFYWHLWRGWGYSGRFIGAIVAPIWRYRMAEREQTRSHRSAKMRVIFLFHSAIRILNEWLNDLFFPKSSTICHIWPQKGFPKCRFCSVKSACNSINRADCTLDKHVQIYSRSMHVNANYRVKLNVLDALGFSGSKLRDSLPIFSSMACFQFLKANLF